MNYTYAKNQVRVFPELLTGEKHDQLDLLYPQTLKAFCEVKREQVTG